MLRALPLPSLCLDFSSLHHVSFASPFSHLFTLAAPSIELDARAKDRVLQSTLSFVEDARYATFFCKSQCDLLDALTVNHSHLPCPQVDDESLLEFIYALSQQIEALL